MDDKTITNCPNCNHQNRIPTGKHVKFICPGCNKEVDYDGRDKETKAKGNSSGWLFAIILGAIIFFGYKHFNKPQINPDKLQVTYENNLNSLVAAVDINNGTTNDFAVRLASKFPGEYNIVQVCQIYDYIVTRWKYVNDSDKGENFRSASRSINNNLAGDCDDFAILMAAMIESIGGDARISFAYDDKGVGHAFTEVLASNNREEMQSVIDAINLLYGTDKFTIYYTPMKNGECWLNMDWFGEPKHPGGQYFEFTKRTVYYPTSKPPKYING
jgi:predicted RNA-binding Zn-ribbon protein involved in translation (DUF1610 family)